MAYKMKGSPFQRNFGIGVSPMRDEPTTWEKIKASAKGLGTGVKEAWKESAWSNIPTSTKYGYKKGKQARKEALKEYSED